MYSLSVPNNEKHSKIRVKGIKKSYLKKKVRHDQFLDVLTTHKSTGSDFCNTRLVNHVLQTVKIKKRCLNAFDDKRYIREDGVATLAYGHKDLRRAWLTTVLQLSDGMTFSYETMWALNVVVYRMTFALCILMDRVTFFITRLYC